MSFSCSGIFATSPVVYAKRFCFDAESLGEGGNNVISTSSVREKISPALATFYLFF